MRRGQGKVFGLNEQHVQSSGGALEHVLGTKETEPSKGVRNEGMKDVLEMKPVLSLLFVYNA